MTYLYWLALAPMIYLAYLASREWWRVCGLRGSLEFVGLLAAIALASWGLANLLSR